MFPVFLQAQKDYPSLVDAYMQAAVNVNQFSGSVLIAKKDVVIYQKNFGSIGYAGTKILDSNSLFELGNITEEFTAAAIMLLKDQGKLELTDQLTKYFPELPYPTVTIKDLLTHTSGLPDYYDEGMKDKWGTGRLASNKDVIKSLADHKIPLAWKPGTNYKEDHYYTEYPLLAAIIEQISGKSYAQFMQQHIFKPLQLNHTIVLPELEATKKQHPNHTESVYFDESKQQFFPADSFRAFSPELGYATNAVVGGIGISSTAHDLFLFNRALISGRLLTASSQKIMSTPQFAKDSVTKMFFGCGVLTGKNEFGNYIQQRDDGNNITLGYITTVINYAMHDVTIIVLANKAKSSSNIAGPLAYILFDRDVVPPCKHVQAAIDTLILDRYVGKYKILYTITIYKKDGTLWMTNRGEPDLKLLPESPTKFFSSSREYDWQIEFKTDVSGRVLKTYFIFSGLKKEATKL